MLYCTLFYFQLYVAKTVQGTWKAYVEESQAKAVVENQIKNFFNLRENHI